MQTLTFHRRLWRRTARCSFRRVTDGAEDGSEKEDEGVSRLLSEELSDVEEGLVPGSEEETSVRRARRATATERAPCEDAMLARSSLSRVCRDGERELIREASAAA